ncbi:MAG: sporulation protein YqfD [Clostridia bacterium]|nr:sporulation protein YqfD [Clostridia bacterium]
MSVVSFKQPLYVDGIMPERALLRLRRAGIAVYGVKKISPKRIRLSVEKKDIEKVFAIYPNVCYNSNVYTPYTVEKAPTKGLARAWERIRTRIGLCLGCLLFFAVTLFADGFVFGVDFVGTDVYARETYAALEEAGIRLFAPYRAGKEDLVCAKLLALDGVEFCSVQKKGMRLQVEIRVAPFFAGDVKKGSMRAEHTGEILSITALRGTALKKKGEFVNAGELLVGDWFTAEDGEQVRVQAIARVRMSCVWEEKIEATTEEEAFAKAYLSLCGANGEKAPTLRGREIALQADGTFLVNVRYEIVQSMNF